MIGGQKSTENIRIAHSGSRAQGMRDTRTPYVNVVSWNPNE